MVHGLNFPTQLADTYESSNSTRSTETHLMYLILTENLSRVEIKGHGL